MTASQQEVREAPPGVLGRRDFLGVLGGTAAVMSACTVGAAGQAETINVAWTERAVQLKSSDIYTAAVPGMWAGKEGTHIPSVTIDASGTAKVSCTHAVAEGHWLSTLWVEDQTGNVIHMAEFLGRGPEASQASTSFRIPAGVTSIVAYAHCNLHDCWSSARIALR